ncbi:MAG TPA: VOC family protein [Pyrinomonadaceae bacterium]|jgi:catechol 2,3-dioxygenase-like lactoylglutathione lyase family enzyme
MKIDSLTPMLRTWDLAGTIEFYTRVLGFQCESQEEPVADLTSSF